MVFSVRRERDCFYGGGNLARIGPAYALARPLWNPAFAGMTVVVHKDRKGEEWRWLGAAPGRRNPEKTKPILPILQNPAHPSSTQC